MEKHQEKDSQTIPSFARKIVTSSTPSLLCGYILSASSKLKKVFANVLLPVPPYSSRRSRRYCKRAKSVFKDLKETPFVVELDWREDGSKIQDALSELVKRRTVPQVFIDGEHIGGSDDTVEAYNSGRLKKLLGSKQSGDADLR